MAFAVDQFTSQQATAEFNARYRAVVDTAAALELQGKEGETPALLFGGAALTLQGIDAHLPNGHGFDVDAVVCGAMFNRIGHSESGFTGGVARMSADGYLGIVLPSRTVPLKADLLTGSRTGFRNFISEVPYTGEENGAAIHMPVGVLAVNASLIASTKVLHGLARVKDLAGLVKAQVVADYAQHPVLEDDLWQLSVAGAMDRLATNDLAVPFIRRVTKRGPAYPAWLTELIAADFNHPAFADIARL